MQFLLEKLSHYWQFRMLAIGSGIVLIVYAVMMPVHSTETVAGTTVGATVPTATEVHTVESAAANRAHTFIRAGETDGAGETGGKRALSPESAHIDGQWLGENPEAAQQLTEIAGLYREDDLPHDYSDLARALRTGAESGDPVAQFLLGYAYELGLGVAKNLHATAEWYERAGAPRHGDGLEAASAGGITDLNAALEAYRGAAERGVPAAELYRGIEYDLGLNVARNRAEAIRWYTKAAMHESASAANNLGVLYHRGNGIPKESAQAVAWLTKAAADGNPSAQYSLGRLYFEGDGLPKDSVRAAGWLQRAARQGNGPAKVLLSLMYATGDGVEGDNSKAYMWINLASETEVSARPFRDAVEKCISAPEFTVGQMMTNEWLAQQLPTSR